MALNGIDDDAGDLLWKVFQIKYRSWKYSSGRDMLECAQLCVWVKVISLCYKETPTKQEQF